MTELGWQFDAEHLEQATDLVLQVDTLRQHRFAAGEQGPDLVTLDTLACWMGCFILLGTEPVEARPITNAFGRTEN